MDSRRDNPTPPSAHDVLRQAGVTALGLVVAFVALGVSADTRTTLPVSVNVVPTARILHVDAPAAVDIGPFADPDGPAGSKAASAAGDLRVEVWTNSRAGVALDLQPTDDRLAGMEITTADGTVRMGPEGGTIATRWNGAPRRELLLHVRFEYTAGLGVGRYAWPLHLAVRPL